jgi:phosphoribosylformylglycinamidine synthase
MEVKTLIISGDGINAENELRNAFLENASFVELIHINDLINNPKLIHDYHIIGFPGGFSFGDEIRSGKVFCLKVIENLAPELKIFIKSKKLIIGICNGFQILTQLNMFGDEDKIGSLGLEKLDFTLTENSHQQFRNEWVKVKFQKTKSPWLKEMENKEFFMPIRHKEGRIFGNVEDDNIAITYLQDVNGSLKNIAGLINKNGNVIGLMPHPEAARYDLLNPVHVHDGNAKWNNQLFINSVNYIKENFHAGLN